MNSPTTRPPKKLRKQYSNTAYPLVVLKFEDGHAIKIYHNTGKVFDVWSGETNSSRGRRCDAEVFAVQSTCA